MKIFNQSSIRGKLISIIVSITFTVILIGFTFVTINDISNLKKQMITEVTIVGNLIGDFCQPFLDWELSDEINEVLERFVELETVHNAIVYNTEGEEFAKYTKKQADTNFVPIVTKDTTNFEFKANYLHASLPIKDNLNKTYGTVYIRVSTIELTKSIQNRLTTILILFLALTVISYIAASTMQRIVSQPVLRLADIMNKVSNETDYSIRVRKETNDEVGILYEGFNRMLDQIELRAKERRKAEQALRDSQELFESFMEHLPAHGLILSKNSQVIYANKAFKDTVGIEDIVGRSTKDIFPEEISVQLIKNQEEALEEGYNVSIETLINKYNQEVIYQTHKFKIKNTQQGNLLGVVAINITEQMKVERALSESELKYRQVVENANDIIIVIQKERIKFYNQKMLEISGYSHDELIGEDISKFVSEDDFKIMMEDFKLRTNSNTVHKTYTISLITKSGKKKIVEVNPIVIKWNKQTAILAFVRDLTERMLMEKEKRAKEEAEKANRAKSEFLANMSHEIRTPMNAILGFSELLLKNSSNPQDKQYLNTILSSGKTLLSLINDILDLSKIEAGKLDIQLDSINIRLLLGEIIQIFSQKALEKGIDLKLDTNKLMNVAVNLDEIRTRQIMFNLVGNAVKFTQKGSVSIYAESSYCLENEEFVKLSIRIVDTGVGIKKEQLEKIFDAFHQESGDTSKKFGGTGLGLTITKRLVEMMNGNIKVKSESGVGSEFIVEFPKLKSEGMLEEVDENLNEEVISLKFEPANLLVVDDIRLNRELIKGYLADTDIKVTDISSGEEAIELLKTFKPDIVLMDLKMPGLSGEDTTKIIRKEELVSGIPIVAFTASVLKDEEEPLMKYFDGIIRKPILRNDLINFIKLYLKHTQKDRDSELVSKLVENQNAITAEAKERLPILIESLENELYEKWKKNSKGISLTSVKIFAEELIQIGEEYKVNLIAGYGKELESYAKNLDVIKMRQSIKEYPEKIDLLKTILVS